MRLVQEEGPVEVIAEESAAATINYDMLRLPEPILWNQEMILFEDELHDNGMSTLSVRMRVMPSCFFILLRLSLRIDNSLVRINDTRYFHVFGESTCVREVKVMEKQWGDLFEMTQGVVDDQGLKGNYANINMLVQHLDTIELKNEVISME